MMLPLLLSLVVSASDDPPVKVWLNHDNYFQRGDKARVNVRLAEDGYVLVLRADAEGRVRVVFPLDPSDDNFVRGHETIEVRGRGDREAFFVDDREGSGLVLVARSTTPFKFDEFVRGDHWDYRVLDARQAGDDKEAALLDMVQRMTAEGRFDYDAVTYVVASARAYYDSYYDSYYPHYVADFGYGYGWPYRLPLRPLQHVLRTVLLRPVPVLRPDFLPAPRLRFLRVRVSWVLWRQVLRRRVRVLQPQPLTRPVHQPRARGQPRWLADVLQGPPRHQCD